jgi:hypothetical protein
MTGLGGEDEFCLGTRVPMGRSLIGFHALSFKSEVKRLNSRAMASF